MLMVTELAEAAECIRNVTADDPCDKVGLSHITKLEEELADVVIRILDFAGSRNLNLASAILDKHVYNLSRPFRHGKTC